MWPGRHGGGGGGDGAQIGGATSGSIVKTVITD